MPNPENISRYKDGRMSRRVFGTTALAVWSNFLLRKDGSQFSTLLHDEDQLFPKQSYEKPKVQSLDIPSDEYIADLFDYLHTADQGDSLEQRFEAIKRARRVFSSTTNYNYFSGVEIDESGVYLTCAHGLYFQDSKGRIDDSGWSTVSVYDPYTDDSYKAVAFKADAETDVALIFAPTGKPAKPTPHIHLSSELPSEGSVWLIGTRPDNDSAQTVPASLINSGIVSSYEGLSLRDTTVYDKQEFNFAVDVDSVKGSSGSPLIDGQGSIIGTVAAGDEFIAPPSWPIINADRTVITKPENIAKLPSMRTEYFANIPFAKQPQEGSVIKKQKGIN